MTAEEILAELKSVGRRITSTEERRSLLYQRQKELVIEGHRIGLKAIDMARARGGSSKNGYYLAESFRQYIRELGK